MTFWKRCLRHPKSLWFRKAIFQIHLWTGIGLGIYVLLISVSGSAIVFRNELYKSLWPGPRLVPISGPRLSREGLKAAARQAWPKYSVSYIWESKRNNEATEIWLQRDGYPRAKPKARLFDPFTGRDLGSSRPLSIDVLAWLSDLHINLLAGKTGRLINGVLAVFVVLLGVTGILVWWPGTRRLRRSLTIDFRANWKRLNWDLHSVVGLWMFAFVFIWGATGVYLVFPAPFQAVVNRFSHLELYGQQSSLQAPSTHAARIILAADPPQRRRRPPIKRSAGDIFLRWFYYLHFGNFGGTPVKALWVLLGFAPPFLFVTGALMWWNRVLSPEARSSRARRISVSREHRSLARVPGAA